MNKFAKLLLIAPLLFFISCGGRMAVAQSLSCTSSASNDGNGNAAFNVTCVGTALGSELHDFQWDTGVVNLAPGSNGLGLVSFDPTVSVTESHGGQPTSNVWNLRLIGHTFRGGTLSQSFQFSDMLPGPVSFVNQSDIGVSQVEASGVFEVKDSFTQCDSFGICSFQISVNLNHN